VETPLNEADVRAMVRLLGEVAALRGDHAEKKARLMHGLCEMIGADKWAWALVCNFAEKGTAVSVSFMQGGFNEEHFGRCLMALEHPDTPRMNGAMMAEFPSHPTHLTRLRHEIDLSGISIHAGSAPLWAAADIAPGSVGLCADGQSLPSLAGNAGIQSECGNALAANQFWHPAPVAARSERECFWRPLQGVADRTGRAASGHSAGITFIAIPGGQVW